MSKFLTLTPAKLALLVRVARVCEWRRPDQWWYPDEAAYAIYGGERTNPQCPLESTDRNPVSSLFPFHNSSGHGFSHAEKGGLDFLPFPLLAPCGGSSTQPQRATKTQGPATFGGTPEGV